VPDIRRAGVVFAIAAQLQIYHVDYLVVATQPRAFRELQSSLLIHSVPGDEQKP
jgi:hypothetical protein